MKNIAFILSAVLVVFSCANNKSKGSNQDADNNTRNDTVVLTNTSIKWSELSSGRECSVEKPANLVITDNKQLDSLWSKAFSGYEEAVKPVVDFSKNSVVVLFLGTVKSGGHSVSITAIQNEKGIIKVEGEHKIPGKSCIATTAIENPYYIALTDPALSGIPEFTIKIKEYECE